MRKTAAILFGLLALLALPIASASAAGKPIVTIGGGQKPLLTSVVLGGTVNPNGSPTTYYFTTGGYGSTQETSAGSGTSAVPATGEALAIPPATWVNYTLWATNSYGTTSASSSTLTRMWTVKLGPSAAPYSSTGSFVIEWPKWGGNDIKISCNSTGEGVIHPETTGTTDEYTQRFSSCKLNSNGGETLCNATVSRLHMNGRLIPDEEHLMNVSIPNGCFFEEGMKLILSNFTLAMPNGETSSLEQAVTLKGTTRFGSNNATVTDQSNWTMAGLATGHKFGWE